MQDCYLSLGSNIGDREANIRSALNELKKKHKIAAVSRAYITKPLYFTEQKSFLNLVVKIETNTAPLQLLKEINNIEAALGRNRDKETRYGPRSIDIDIILYNDLVMDSPQLSIPHPRMHERAFVLIPLLEIAPELHCPKTGKAYTEYLKKLDLTDWTSTPEGIALEL